MSYDSTEATVEHIDQVARRITAVIEELKRRAISHDASKLVDPEKDIFDVYTPKLKGATKAACG